MSTTATPAATTTAAPRYKDLRSFLALLDEKKMLHHVTAPVDLDFELGAISYRSLIRNGPALLFENVKGYPGKPLLTNVMYREDQLGLALNDTPDWDVLRQRIQHGITHRLASVVVDEAPCHENVITGDDAVLSMFPTPLWHELDGGRYIATTAGIVTQDPQTGAFNMGQYRSMIIDDKHCTVKIHGDYAVGATPPGGSLYGGAGDRTGAAHILENEAKGIETPCAIVLGMDPCLTMAAGTAVPTDAAGHAEYEAAGAWRGSPTELVKCKTNDLLVPAGAEIVLEGKILVGERHFDGPHGESSGFYNKNFAAFVFEVTAITHRDDPISFGLICGRVEDYPRPLMRSESILDTLVRKSGLTNLQEVFFPDAGAHGCLIIRATITAEGQAKEIIDAAYEHLGYRWVIVVDDDCNVRDWNDVIWRIVSSADPERHIFLGKEKPRPEGRPGELDFVPPKRGMGIDATLQHKTWDFPFPPASKPTPELLDQVAKRWPELGLQ